MNGKGKKTKKQAINSNSAINVLSQEELSRRIAVVEASLKASNWRDTQVERKFKNQKRGFQLVDKLATSDTAKLFPSPK